MADLPLYITGEGIVGAGLGSGLGAPVIEKSFNIRWFICSS
jgi:hypothetical protein